MVTKEPLPFKKWKQQRSLKWYAWPIAVVGCIGSFFSPGLLQFTPLGISFDQLEPNSLGFIVLVILASTWVGFGCCFSIHLAEKISYSIIGTEAENYERYLKTHYAKKQSGIARENKKRRSKNACAREEKEAHLVAELYALKDEQGDATKSSTLQIAELEAELNQEQRISQLEADLATERRMREKYRKMALKEVK